MPKKKPRRVVIVGGVAGGAKTAAKIRREDPNAEIIIFSEEELVSYAGCGEPYYISGDISDREKLIARTPKQFESLYQIQVHTMHRVIQIDPNKKGVEVLDLKTGISRKEPYHVLVIATGATPIIPPVPGADLKGVYTLRTVADAVNIRNQIESGTVKNAVVVGAGFIGLEMVESLARKGIAVTLVERLPQAAPAYDADVAVHIENVLQRNGVQVLLASSMEKIAGNGQSAVSNVIVNGETIPAELVLLSVGIRPNVELARNAGIKIGITGAIQVDDHLRTNIPNIYAAGDCAEQTHIISGKPVWVPLGSTANRQGRVLGINIAGGDAIFPGVLGTNIFRVFDLNVAGTGLSEREARKAGFEIETAIVPASDLPHYMPGGKTVITKLIADRTTRKILGAQVWGAGKVDKVIDTLAAALSFKATVDDLTQLDLAYAPPFAPPLGNIITAANVLQNKLDGKTEGILPSGVIEKEKQGNDFIFIDVRNPEELKTLCLENSVNIPLPQLAARASELPKDKEIITSCGVGLRAATAYRILKHQGLKKVRYMDGGITAWPHPKAKKI